MTTINLSDISMGSLEITASINLDLPDMAELNLTEVKGAVMRLKEHLEVIQSFANTAVVDITNIQDKLGDLEMPEINEDNVEVEVDDISAY